MYKGKGPFGAQLPVELRPKKLPRDPRKTFPANSYEQPRDSSHNKNELSKCMSPIS